ncbi:MAG TPA: LPS export ABC transporter periplasmic protein LptC [Caldimonas sp.]|jgi:lipopolysaccharide export system protein LptC|nr:LPS export ABC transporter periplasmic protein LptC [Caldimonas sp.]HEV7575376.1 LPS export ABC transporter periplasmic protein LptC [Caldimonas sp.]
MARDEPGVAPASGGLDDDDEVDLSFAGPEPVAAAPWPLRLLDVVSAYLPLLMMAVLASATWWLVRNAPNVETPRAALAPRHEADYVMTSFVVQRFGSDGVLRTQIEGDRLRHFPDDDTLEIDRARIRAIGSDGVVTLANANRALANGDGSEMQLIGDAHVVRPAHGKEEQIEFRGEFLQAFRNVERLRSHLPVVVTQGRSVVRADGMEYDNLARVVDLKGRNSATFVSPPRPPTR